MKDNSSPLLYQKKVTATTTTTDIEFDQVPEGEFWFANHASYENQTATRGNVKVGVRRRAYDHWLTERATPSGGQLYNEELEVWLAEGDQIVIRQESTVAADILEGYITGKRCFLKGK